jgi:hypothetical protein
VGRSGSFRQWGHASFESYCSDEVHVSAATARKLVKSYAWLGAEAPELLPPHDGPRMLPRDEGAQGGPLPDFNTVAVMADAKREMEAERVPEDAYLALKQAALSGEMGASQLKRTLQASIPEHLRKKAPDDKVRHLRRALTSCVKVIDGLREWDAGGDAVGEDLLVQAEALRDSIALRLPRADKGEPAA